MTQLNEVQKRNPFHRPLMPSPALAAIVGPDPISRPQMIKKVWAHIKHEGLQDKDNRRMINADDALLRIFEQPQVSMFQMTRILSAHLQPIPEGGGAGA